MNLILHSLVPIAFVITLGWFVGWRKIMDAKLSSQFAAYVLNISFPCLLLVKTATSKFEDLVNYRFVVGMLFGLMGMYILILLLNRYIYRRHLSHSCQTAFVSAFPNMAFMGIPIFMVLFGEQSLVSIVIGNIITSLIMIPMTVSVLEFSKEFGVRTKVHTMMLKVFTKPLIIAPVIGFIISALNFKLPVLALDSLKLVGSTTSGVSLFTLGLLISAEKLHFNRYILQNVFIKNFAHPAIMYGIVIIFGITGVWAKEAILLTAMPSAITTAMFAAKYDELKAETSSSVILGTAISLLSLAFIIYMLNIS
jgi:malonate transporter and related proteins